MADASSMGPLLKGWSPPFTPTGNASYWKVEGPGFSGTRTMNGGIMVRLEADADRVAKLLPAPLEPTDRTGEVSAFVNQTISLPYGLEDLSAVEPDATRFHEALIVFPCRLGDQDYAFHYIMYTNSATIMYHGFVAGLTTKLADIRLLTPFPPHPLWAIERQGSILKGSVSRDGARLITVNFRIGHEVDAKPVFEFAPDIVGMRYFPDMANRDHNAPLVQDLCIYELENIDYGKAYSGEATIEFGDLETEELDCFQPKRIIDAHYLTGLSYRNRGARVIYDYLT